MIYKCATCGKEFDALWPDLYRYKRGGTFLCSWGCLRKYDKEEGSDLMARMKKDGTPAKRPGPKPKVELVYDESIAEEYRREQAEKNKAPMETFTISSQELAMATPPDPVTGIWTIGADGYKATAIKKDGIGEFYFDKRSGTIDWRNEYGEEVSLLPADWERLAEEIPKMLKILGAEV